MRVIDNTIALSVVGFSLQDGQVNLFGWLADAKHPISDVSIYFNDKLWLDHLQLLERPDVYQKRFPRAPHTAHSGLDIHQPLGSIALVNGCLYTRIVAWNRGVQCGEVQITLRDLSNEAARIPIPPEDLQRHIGQNGVSMTQDGWLIYSDVKRNVERLRPFGTLNRVLDWGCGCGRVTRFLIEDVAPAKVFGCDIDAEAIQWSTEHMAGASFAATGPQPPLPYADDFFDLVFGISIFTHFDEQTQFKWLAELARITRKDGLVAVSVLSPANAPQPMQARLQRHGFADERSAQSTDFTQYADPEYYRLTFHTRNYIEKQWSAHFDLVEYVVMGINSHQDFVLMQPKKR